MAVAFYRLMKMLGYETANPGTDGDGREVYNSRPADRSPTSYQTGQIRTWPTLPFHVHSNICVALHATDGTDEHDFVIQFQSGNRQPTKIHHQALSSLHGTTSTITDCIEKPRASTPVYMHNLDGHRTKTINHPDDRPRAHHRRSSSQHEMASESSYRHGPNAESGSSES